MKKEKEKLTADDYRRRAAAHKNEMIICWKTFGKVGVFILAAVCIVVVLGVAWFANRKDVQGGGMKVQTASEGDFELAAEGTVSSVGLWDDEKMSDVAVGDMQTISNRQLMVTGENKNAIRWAITESSHMGNVRGTGIRPGSLGKLTFYIIAKKSGRLTVTLDVSMVGMPQSEDDTLSQDVLELLDGHVLLFAGYDTERMAYGGWISEDAKPWQMTLQGDDQASAVLEWTGDGTLIWNADVTENTAYPISIYWIWPEYLGEYVFKDSTYMKDCPVLFPEDVSPGDEANPFVLPADLFEKMCQTTEENSRSNKYFMWAYRYHTPEEQQEKKQEFCNTVTEARLLDLRNGNYDKSFYDSACDYYNRADQYLGENVRYLKLCIDAQ